LVSGRLCRDRDRLVDGLDRVRLGGALAVVRAAIAVKERTFVDLQHLVPLVQRAADATASWQGMPAGSKFPDAAQWELCRRVLVTMGFDFARGRLDRSTHPFTLEGGSNDVRLTIRTSEDDPSKAVLTVLHEGGHAVYDQGFAQGDRDSLLGEAPSMGLHESQSRLWENHVGRSLAFWEYLFPTVAELFPDRMNGLDGASFYRTVNHVRCDKIRVDADEMSYHLHILLRYELELALVSGELAVSDLPSAWNEKMQTLLGITPACDREGVLQDVHWSLGAFGYFPTYTLGSLYSAQLAETYARQHPLWEEIRRGHFGGLLGWLREHIHANGHRYSAEETVTRATGQGLDASAFFRHLASKLDMSGS